MPTAYQKIKRDEYALLEPSKLLYPDLSKAVVKQISLAEAKSIIVKYEWLGCMPAVNWLAYGIFFDDNIGGCVVFGQEYAENLGVWNKYDFTHKLILLSRGVCVHWTPINTGSFLIMHAIKQLPEKYKIVTCTVDSLAGEVGTIYQACNFYYVGSMRASNSNIKGNKLKRDAWTIDGKLYGSRSLRAKLGTQKKEAILKAYPTAIYTPQVSKERYFYFSGTKQENKYHLSKIQHLIKDHKKREYV